MWITARLWKKLGWLCCIRIDIRIVALFRS
jgi:hypothetical protein